jgi:bacteriocin-like protein
MDHIEMTDRNPSDLGVMEELTDEELSAIDGGALGAVGGATGSILDNVFNSKPISLRSAGAWAVGGAIAGSLGGLPGAGLAGPD